MNFEDFKRVFEKKEVTEFPNSVPPGPLVTICIFTYQQILLVKQCIEGILNQKTKFQFEIVIGEDNSTDGTRELCIEYAEKYPKKIRLLLHHRENNIPVNGHATGKFNVLYGYYSSRGKYIAICEGDDYWTDPLKLQKQIDFLDSHPDYFICYHKVSVLNGEDGTIHESGLNPYEEIKTFTLKDLTTHNFIETVSVVFRNEGLDQLPEWFTKSPVGDYPLHMLNARKGKIGFLPDNMAVYRHHNTSYWSSQSSLRQKTNLLTTLDFLIEEFKDDPEVKQGLVLQRFSYMNDIALEKLKDGDKESFPSFFKDCINLYPAFSEYWLTHGMVQFTEEKERVEQALSTIKTSTTYRLLKKIKIFK